MKARAQFGMGMVEFLRLNVAEGRLNVDRAMKTDRALTMERLQEDWVRKVIERAEAKTR
jgi:hypothetical protein